MSAAMHERVSVSSLCFPGAALPEMADHWRELAPQRIGFMSGLLDDDTVARRIVKDGGYRFGCLGHLFLWGRHVDAREDEWTRERAALTRAIDAVPPLGGQAVYMLTGGHGALTWEEAAQRFSAGIATCVAHAEAAGVSLAIETTSPLYADAHLTHTLRDTVTLAEMAGLGVSIDIYACWTEAGLKATIERALPRLCLVQVADYVYGDRSLPSRAVPGDGDIPLLRIFDWLLSAGYTGAFELELIGPRIDAEGRLEATRRAADRVGALLDELGA